jgi:hypothetical protein
MEPEGSLPCSQEPATGPCLDSDVQSIPPHPISLRSILISYPDLSLRLPSGLFPYGFATKTVYAFLFSPKRATLPAHLILHYSIILIICVEEYKL